MLAHLMLLPSAFTTLVACCFLPLALLILLALPDHDI
jgi:hypothetical protein